MPYNIILISTIYIYPHSLKPLNPTPLDCHRAPGLNSLHHTSNFHWLSFSHMVKYMFQCYSLDLSHALLPASCPQVYYVCISTAALQTGSSILSFQIPYININTQCLFFFLIYSTLYCYTGSRFIHTLELTSNEFLFMADYLTIK